MNELTQKLDKEKCKQWRRDKTRNPINNQRIQEGKIRYKQIEKICSKKEFESSPKKVSNNISSSKTIKNNSISNDIIIEINDSKPYYPSIRSDNFSDELGNLQEFSAHTLLPYSNINSIKEFDEIVSKECPKSSMNKAYFQYFIQHYLSSRTPYRSVLLYYSVGVGKTCSAVSIAEGLLESHNGFGEPLIYVILPASLKNNFLNSIFDITKIKKNQCTGDTYINLAKINTDLLSDEKNLQRAQKDIKDIIKKRYVIFSYGEFIKQSANLILNNKVVIVDEAHNVRNPVIEDIKDVKDIKLYDALKKVLERGNNNRLVLLSGTPMYNEPDEIIDLINLILINERKEPIDNLKLYDKNNKLKSVVSKLIIDIAKHYISFIDNKNPFAYAVRLSPKDAIKDAKNAPVNNKEDYNWITNIKDGLIMTELGKYQVSYIKKHYKGEDIEEALNEDNDETNPGQGYLHGFQALNFVYKDKVGETGFWYLFERVANKNSLMVKYRDSDNPLLKPEKEYLGKYGSKILRVCEEIKDSEGIVVVYSRLLWGGALPLAIALEHMGYNRYGVANNLLEYPREFDNKGSYVILTSPVKDLMGTKSQSLDAIINKINADNNKNGENIKVIIITQKASEGLSFFNVRQVHVLDPWFHMNRIEQIVGRGIRRCSHTSLPIDKRNVLVYLHCSYMKDKLSIDANAYRIASRKIEQMFKIRDIIRDNAFDCGIQKNINFYSKFMFAMDTVELRTSKGDIIPYVFGEFADQQPRCKNPIGDDRRGVREDTMDISELLAKNILEIFKNTTKNYIKLDEIINKIKTYDGDIDYIYIAIDKIVFPNKVLDGYTLHYYKDGIHRIKDSEYLPEEIELEYNETNEDIERTVKTKKKYTKKQENNNTNANNILDNILKFDNEFNQKWHMYLEITSDNWSVIVKDLINNNKYESLKRILINEGALIESNNKIIGYVDIFSTDRYILYDLDGEILNQDKTDKIMKRMKEVKMDGKLEYGSMMPIQQKKLPYKSFDFKIHDSKDKKGKVIGASCMFKQKDEINKKLKRDVNTTKANMCRDLAKIYNDNDNMLFYPIYKPNK